MKNNSMSEVRSQFVLGDVWRRVVRPQLPAVRTAVVVIQTTAPTRLVPAGKYPIRVLTSAVDVGAHHRVSVLVGEHVATIDAGAVMFSRRTRVRDLAIRPFPGAKGVQFDLSAGGGSRSRGDESCLSAAMRMVQVATDQSVAVRSMSVQPTLPVIYRAAGGADEQTVAPGAALESGAINTSGVPLVKVNGPVISGTPLFEDHSALLGECEIPSPVAGLLHTRYPSPFCDRTADELRATVTDSETGVVVPATLVAAREYYGPTLADALLLSHPQYVTWAEEGCDDTEIAARVFTSTSLRVSEDVFFNSCLSQVDMLRDWVQVMYPAYAGYVSDDAIAGSLARPLDGLTFCGPVSRPFALQAAIVDTMGRENALVFTPGNTAQAWVGCDFNMKLQLNTQPPRPSRRHRSAEQSGSRDQQGVNAADAAVAAAAAG